MSNIVRFDELNLADEILRALQDINYENATPIQAQSIPMLLAKHDVLGQAQTGTGKTLAFGIPAVQSVDPSNKAVQVLVLCPTRELAMQVTDEMTRLVKHLPSVRLVSIFGGQSIDKQIQSLRRGVHIVVGTPGRVMDHLDRGTLHLDECKMIVLDEADEMLDMGFREDIESILQEMPAQRQTVFFSATMAPQILDMTKRYQKDTKMIKVAAKALTVSSIEQKYIDLREKDKADVLERLVDLHEPKLCLVFCNTKRKVDEVVAQLQQDGYFAEALHGDMRQAIRTQVMNKFRQGVIQVLVATDVAARGIDVEDVEMVVNFDVPLDTEYYVHRIGRTGRAGRSGMAFTLAAGKERGRLHDIERYAKTTITRDKIPSLKDIEAKKRTNFIQRIKHTVEAGELEKYTEWVAELEREGVSPAQAAAALIKLEIHHQIAEEDKVLDSESMSSTNASRPQHQGMVRLFVNLGRKHKVGPKDIVGAIAGEAGMAGRLIGEIDIYDNFLFVEVPQEQAEHVIQRMKKALIRGNRFTINVADDSKMAPSKFKKDKKKKQFFS